MGAPRIIRDGKPRPAPITGGSRIEDGLAAFRGELAELEAAAVSLPGATSTNALALTTALRGCVELQRRTAKAVERETTAAAKPLSMAVVLLPPTSGETQATNAGDRAAARSAMEQKFLADAGKAIRARLSDAHSAVAGELATRAASALNAFDRQVDLLRAREALPPVIDMGANPAATTASLLARSEQRIAVEARVRADVRGFCKSVDTLAELAPDEARSLLDLAEPSLLEVAQGGVAKHTFSRQPRREGAATDDVIAASKALALLKNLRGSQGTPGLDAAEAWGERARVLFMSCCGIDPRTWGSSASAYMEKFGSGARGGPGARYATDEPGSWPFRISDAVVPNAAAWKETVAK